MTSNPKNQAGKAITGGEFLIRKTAAQDIFIPEEWNEEQRMIKKMTHDFIAQRVHLHMDAIDQQEMLVAMMEEEGNEEWLAEKDRLELQAME